MRQFIKKLFKPKKGNIKKKLPRFNNRDLPKSGRSSVDDTLADTLKGYSSFFNIVNPLIPTGMLEYIALMSIVEPEFSKAIMNFRSTANTGINIEVAASNDQLTETAIKRINAKIEHLFALSPGRNGLVNHMFDQISMYGASSNEAEIDKFFTGVKKIVDVPNKAIRFLREDGEWKPYQQIEHNLNAFNKDNLNPLNSITYRYYPLQTIDNSPYGIPPLLSAVAPQAIQKNIYSQIEHIVDNMRLMGINVAKIPPPPELEEDETPEQYQDRYQDYIADIVDMLCKTYKEGFLGLPSEIDLQNFNTTSNAAGLKDIIDRVEKRLHNGLKQDPGLLGSHTSRTETFLTVIYKILVHYAEDMRRVVSFRLEEILMLDLILSQIIVDRVIITFNPNSSLKPVQEAQARKIKVDTTLSLLREGVISPKRAANDLGYDTFHDEELFKKNLERKEPHTLSPSRKRFALNQSTNEFEIDRETYDIDRYESENTEKDRAEKVRAKLRKYIELYLEKVLPYFSELGTDVTDYAAQYCQEHIEEIAQDSEILKKAVIEYIREHPQYKKIQNPDSWLRKTSESITIKAGKDWLENDDTVFGGKKPDISFVFGEGDRNAMKFYSRLHTFFFSSCIDNKGFGSKIDSFINTFLERGEALYGGWTDAVEKEFARLFGETIQGDFRVQVERIINTGMANIKNRSHVIQLDQAGFNFGRINGYLETDCDICKALHTKKIPISNLMKQVTAFESAETPEAALEIIKSQNIGSADEAKDIKGIIASGRGLPPFHPNCKCFIEGDFE